MHFIPGMNVEKIRFLFVYIAMRDFCIRYTKFRELTNAQFDNLDFSLTARLPYFLVYIVYVPFFYDQSI